MEDPDQSKPTTRSSTNRTKKTTRIPSFENPDGSFQIDSEKSWKCSSCRNEYSAETLATLLDKIIELQARISALEQNQNNKFSKAAKETSREKAPKCAVTHQVIVSGDDKNTFSKETFAEKVKKNLRSVPISNVKVSKEGLGIIDFPNEETRNEGLAQLQPEFNVQPNNRAFRSLLPKVTIYDIDSNDFSSTDTLKLKTAICEKNPALKTLIEKNKVFDILFIKEDPRRSRSSLAAVKMDQEVYEVIKSQNFQVFIHFSRCRIVDRIHITQCYKCQKFGHMRSNCTLQNDRQVCRFCSGNHEGRTCTNKGNYQTYKCGNCSLNHSSTYPGCSVLQNQVLLTASRTKGMEDFTKNKIRPQVIAT